MTADRWEYVGTEKRANQKARVWRLTSEPSEGYGSYQSNYTFYVTKVNSWVKVEARSGTTPLGMTVAADQFVEICAECR